jgi:hypothetical protein
MWWSKSIYTNLRTENKYTKLWKSETKTLKAFDACKRFHLAIMLLIAAREGVEQIRHYFMTGRQSRSCCRRGNEDILLIDISQHTRFEVHQLSMEHKAFDPIKSLFRIT